GPRCERGGGNSTGFRLLSIWVVRRHQGRSLCGAAPRTMSSVMPALGHAAGRLDIPLLFHFQLGFEILKIAVDRSNRKHTSIALVAQQAILPRNVAFDRQLVPLLGMTAVDDRNVVMHAPEERDSGEFYSSTQHVERCGLAMTLRNNPVLDANILAGMRI